MTQQISTVQPGSMPTTGRWGWYKDHAGNEFRRVSTLIKKVETDNFNLELWKQRQVVVGLAARDDLVFAAKAVGAATVEGFTKDQKKTLNDIAKTAREVAKAKDGATIGTAVHTLTERLDRGEQLEQLVAGLPAVHGETVRAYAALRALNNWCTVEIERTVVCDELEVAGTFDRIDLVPGLAALLGHGECQYGHVAAGLLHDPSGENGTGELPVVVDVKTEEEPWRNGLHIAPQLAIYSRARRMWRPVPSMASGEYVPAPCVRQDVAIVVHLREGRAVPYFVNLTVGWQLAQRAAAQLRDENGAKQRLGTPGCWFAAVPNVVEPKPAQMLVEHAQAENYAGGVRPGPGKVAADDAETAIANAYAPAVAAQMIPADPTAGLCPNCAPLIIGASTDRVDGTDPRTLCATCANITPEGIPERVAVRGPDGLVRWTVAQAERKFDEHDELRIKLIEQIWKTETVAGLGILWNMAKDRGVLWSGPVQQAGDARRRQIECVQRGTHSGTGQCACGWMAGLPA